MNRKLCLLLTALCLAVAVVKCETSIEVDANGDEYEVRKFNIQGRQLNEGRSQCVVTRRKRSTVGIAPEDDSNETDEADYRAYSQAEAMLFYSPHIANDDDDDYDDGNLDEEEEQEMNDDKKHPNVYTDEEFDSGEDDNGDSDDDGDYDKNGDDDDDDDDDGPNTIEIIHVPHFSVLGQRQGQVQSAGAVVSAANSAFAAAPGSSSNNNGIEVVHGHEPPKVNPQTHAVFELLPVKQQSNQQGVVIGHEGQVVKVSSAGIEVAGGNNDDDDFRYNEDINPVTTTAIWSTGDGDHYDVPRPPKRARKPLKNRNSMKKKNKNKKMQNKNKFTNKNKVNQKQPTRNKNKKINRRPTNKRRPSLKDRRPVNKRKITGLRKGLQNKKKTTTSKRRKLGNQKNKNKKQKKHRKEPERLVITSSPISNDSDDNRLDGSTNQGQSKIKRKNKNSNANRNEVARKRKNQNNVNIVDQGTNTFTRTMTMTQTGGPNDNRDVNCIYINKDPPSTTPRSLWNVLGRSANGGPRASGHYGNRKRVNMRLLA